jgi:hypothetical protein
VDLKETCSPRRVSRERCLDIDAVPRFFDVVDLNDQVNTINGCAEGQRVPLALIVQDLQSHAAEIEPKAPGVRTIPSVDDREAEEPAVELDHLVIALSSESDVAH